MPSPFPGMDPYMEHPARWGGVHQGLITGAAAALNAILPPHYVADIGERIYVVEPDRSVYPDVFISSQRRPGTSEEASRGGVAVAAPSEAPWVLTVFPIEMREVFIEVLPVADQSRVVTAIEVLSPSNKAAGEGRDLYLAKQRELLNSDTHLIEIDLLRRGSHTVAAPRSALVARGRWDYLVCLHRTNTGRQFEVWPILLRERLPVIRVPLAGSDPDVDLDLQPVLDRWYEEGGYSRRLDYTQEPPVPLSPEDAAWADALLREKGLRPAGSS